MSSSNKTVNNYVACLKLVYFIRFYILLILFVLSVYQGNAQDIKPNSDKLEFLFSIGFKQLNQNTPFTIKKHIDPVVEEFRHDDGTPYYSPFMHNSVFMKTGLNITYNNKYQIISSIFMEQRDWSRGLLAKNTTFVFMKTRIVLADSFALLRRKFNWYFDVGDLYSGDEMEFGLKAYNIDLQGINASLSVKNFRWTLLYAADMSQSEGLNIDEYVRTKVMWKHQNISMKGKLYTGISIDYMKNIIDRQKGIKADRFNLGYLVSEVFSENFRIDFIADYSLNSPEIVKGVWPNTAIFLEVNYHKKTKLSNLIVKPKIRFYGINYKSENYENSYFYYDYRYRRTYYPYSDGPFLYPLKNYFYPVSQYAFYTEYQNAGDILSLELEAMLDFTFYRKFHSQFSIEGFNIHRKVNNGKDYFSYLFYTYYLYASFEGGLQAGLYLSNKQYNQDVHYMTFYQMNYPFFGIHISYDGLFTMKLDKNISESRMR